MTKNRALNHIPKTHTIRKKAVEEIIHLVYPGSDKDFRKSKSKEIEQWLADGIFFGNENPVELAKEWQEYSKETHS